jgi:hypothetical protein
MVTIPWLITDRLILQAMKWFQNINTLDELRTAYRKLAVRHHPDKGGSTADMQEINAEYEILSKR